MTFSLASMGDRPRWQDAAACATLLADPKWAAAFFPVRADVGDDPVSLKDAATEALDAAATYRETGADNHGTRAKQVCASCPVWRECLTEAVDRRESEGIWGGAGGAYLRHLRRQRLHGIEAWQGALEQHRRVLDYVAGRGPRPQVGNRNGPGAEDGRVGTYAKGCRLEASQWAVADRYLAKAPPVDASTVADTSSDITSDVGEETAA